MHSSRPNRSLPPPTLQVLRDLPDRDAMDFVAMEAGEVAQGKSWAEQEKEQEKEKAEANGAGAMDEEEEEEDGDESMEVG